MEDETGHVGGDEESVEGPGREAGDFGGEEADAVGDGISLFQIGDGADW